MVTLTGIYWQDRRDRRGGEWVAVFKAGAMVRHWPLGPWDCTQRAEAETEAQTLVDRLTVQGA